MLRLDDGSLIVAVRTYDKDTQSRLLFVNSHSQIVSTQLLTPFRPMRLWLEPNGGIAMLGRLLPSDELMDAEPQARELVLRTYEKGSSSLRMLSSKPTGIVLPVPATRMEWEPRDIMPAGGHVAVLIERRPKPRFAELSVDDGSVFGEWAPEGPTMSGEGKSAALRLGEFTLTASHRLIAFFNDASSPHPCYFELNRATNEWTPVKSLNRAPDHSNIYASEGEKVLVFIADHGRIGFSWISVDESTQTAKMQE